MESKKFTVLHKLLNLTSWNKETPEKCLTSIFVGKKRKKYVFYVGSDYYGYLIPFTYLLKKINWYLSIS